MMKPHDAITDQLSNYIDGELPVEQRAEIERHLAGCDGCREVANDLRTIVGTAPRLPAILPERELWPGVAARIGAQRDPRLVPFGRRSGRRFSFTLPQLAAAGLALMVLSGAAVHLLRSGGGDDTRVPVSRPQIYGVAPVGLADPHYDSAVADLEEALDEGRSRLDPETIRILEQNLRTIDEAIEQSRRALEADPANAFLTRHLASARHRKLALLRTAAALTTGS